MSYCVQCGVELAPSERDCPLCGTAVLNPRCDWEAPDTLPYPDTVDVKEARIDRRYARQLVAILLTANAVITLLLNFLGGGGLTWSPYVIGAVGLLYCWFVVPLLYKFSRPYAFVGFDFAALGLFLFLVALMSGGMGWYLRLIIPLLLLSGITFILIMLSLRRLEWPWLYRIALACLAFGLFLPGVETLIRWYAGYGMRFEWSFYAAIPIAVFAAALLLVERNKPLKEEIRKKLFI